MRPQTQWMYNRTRRDKPTGPARQHGRALASPALIGLFVVGALVMIFATVLLLTGNKLFARKEQVVMHFEGSIYGLQVGAPVVFRGVRLGSVTSIGLSYDPSHDEFSIPVIAELDRNKIKLVGKPTESTRDDLSTTAMVKRGLRAQLSMQSLLTGQLYVDLDFRAEKPSRRLQDADPTEAGLVEIPTVATAIQEFQHQIDGLDFRRMIEDLSQIASSARKLVSAPQVQAMMDEVLATTRNVNRLVVQLNRRADPLAQAAQGTLGATQQAMERLGDAATRAGSASDKLGTASDKLGSASDAATGMLRDDAPVVRSVQQAADELARSAAALRQTTRDDGLLMQRVEQALQDVSRAARAVRELADELEQQPQSVITGKPRAR